jgi:hypothetical protein
VVVVVLVELVLEVLLELELVELVELDDPVPAVVGTACCTKGSLLLKVESSSVTVWEVVVVPDKGAA